MPVILRNFSSWDAPESPAAYYVQLMRRFMPKKQKRRIPRAGRFCFYHVVATPVRLYGNNLEHAKFKPSFCAIIKRIKNKPDFLERAFLMFDFFWNVPSQKILQKRFRKQNGSAPVNKIFIFYLTARCHCDGFEKIRLGILLSVFAGNINIIKSKDFIINEQIQSHVTTFLLW